MKNSAYHFDFVTAKVMSTTSSISAIFRIVLLAWDERKAFQSGTARRSPSKMANSELNPSGSKTRLWTARPM